MLRVAGEDIVKALMKKRPDERIASKSTKFCKPALASASVAVGESSF